jgi:CBS domain-containing protein
MVLISDIARKVLAKDKAPERVNVYEVMAKPVISVDPDMDIRYCARLFDRFHLSRCPVVENGKVIGIISFTDMVLRGLLADID